MAQAHPLEWPAHWPRTETILLKRAIFKSYYREISLHVARERLQGELDRLKAVNPVLSTDMRLRLDGAPRSDAAMPDDPGAAVYFNLDGAAYCLACDKWDRLPDNVAAIAAHIAAMRGQDRWGVGNTSRAFAGYKALPAPGDAMMTERPWWEVLDVNEGLGIAHAEAAYRELCMKHHPDRPGGDAAAFQEITAAIGRAREELAGQAHK